ncbi:MAG: L-threonylcarbamoyladenylate synthase [bacterium]
MTLIHKNSDETRARAGRIIADGGVIAFRTDTFYGLGADPFNPTALQKIRELKGRKDTKPILLLISDASEVDRFIAERTRAFDEIAEQCWPGPITLIGVARAELPSPLTAGTNSIGLRLPNDETLRKLVRQCGGALTATSANPSGHPPARTADEVENYFSRGIDLIVDGGEVSATEPSTVLDLSGPEARLVREGAIKRSQLPVVS